MSDIRLIAMDMDGTLLNSSQQVSPGNAAALRAAREKGIHLAICSGRLVGDIGLFARENHLDDCALLSLNGAYCVHRLGGEPFCDITYPDSVVQEILDVLLPENVILGCFAGNSVAAFDKPDPAERKKWGSHVGCTHAPQVLFGMEGLERVRGRGINKFVCVIPDLEKLDRLRKRMEEIAGTDVTSSWKGNFELMPPGCSKGSAVAALAQQLGLSASQVMTFGDYDNDLPMISWAGMGIAMGNATQSVLQAAKHITLTNDEDGVAAAIRRFALDE